MALARRTFSLIGVILLVEVAAEFYLIAAAAFSVWGASDGASSIYAAFKSGDSYASLHGLVGTLLLPLTTAAMLVVAFPASLDRGLKLHTGGLLGLMAVQFLLGRLASAGTTPALLVGALHGVTALAIVGAAGSLVVRTWAFGSAKESAGASV